MAARLACPPRPLRRSGRAAAPAHLQPRTGARQLDRRAEAGRGIRHQPHAAARGAEGAGRRGPGDDEGAPRRLRDRGVGDGPGRRLPPARRCSKATRPASWRSAPPMRSSTNCRRCTTSWKPPPATATTSSPSTSASTCACWQIADNRWRDQMVADLRKVMKLNRHNSLLKSGRIEESLREHRAVMEALDQARRQGHRQEDAGAFPQRAGSRGLTRFARP